MQLYLLIIVQRRHSHDWKNMQHKAGLHYKTTDFNWRYWITLQRFGCFNSAPSFYSLIKQTKSSTKQPCIAHCILQFSEFNKRTQASKLINTSANLEDHHQRQQLFSFSSFIHKCNVMDPIHVHMLTSPKRQWLDQSKQEDGVCAPSLCTFLISFFNKNPFLPLLWNLKQTSVLLQLLLLP